MVCWGIQRQTFASVFTAMLHYVLIVRIRTVYNVIKTIVALLCDSVFVLCGVRLQDGRSLSFKS